MIETETKTIEQHLADELADGPLPSMTVVIPNPAYDRRVERMAIRLCCDRHGDEKVGRPCFPCLRDASELLGRSHDLQPQPERNRPS